MAITQVQAIGGTRSGSGANFSRTFVSNVTAGNLIVASCVAWNRDLPSTAVTDSQGNTYTRRVFVLDSGNNVCALYTATAGSSGSLTVTETPALSTFLGMCIYECSFGGGFTIGNTNSNTQTGSSHTSNSVSTTSAILFGVLRCGNAPGTITPNASWTDNYTDSTFTNVPNSHISRIVASGGSFAATWTTTNLPISQAAILAVEETGGGATGQPTMRRWGGSTWPMGARRIGKGW